MDGFEVVLVFGFGESLDLHKTKRYVELSGDSQTLHAVLENFQVVDEFVLELGLPVYLLHGDSLAEGVIQQLAVDSSCS